MQLKISAAAAVLAAAVAAQGTRPILGEPVLGIPAAGKTVVAFLACGTAADCRREIQQLGRIEAELGKLGFRALPVLPGATGPSGKLAQSFPGQPRPFAILVENGRVRRVIPDVAEGLVRQARSWNDGKVLYDTQCARCHGADGQDTSYPQIKPLNGIGTRMSEPEIIEATILTGAVDLTPLTPLDRKALAAYVAGL